MKARILELIITPENIESEDLQLLKDEIAVQPYAQSLRALYLLGTKKYDAENFQKVLSTTAAYTTHKKILYQLINGKVYEAKMEEVIPENANFNIEETPTNINDDKTEYETQIVENIIAPERNWLADVPEKEAPKKVILDGVLNRILFPGEENFLNDSSTAKIDIEATAESGVLVSEKSDDENIETKIFAEKSPEKFRNDLLSLKSENTEVEAEEILNKKEEKPEIIIENRISENVETNIEVEKPIINKEKTPENKYEIERKKLAEEIERKMSESKKAPKISLDEDQFEAENATVDFFHSQEFIVKDGAPKAAEIIIKNTKNENKDCVLEILKEEFATENVVDKNSDWKPMNSSGSASSRFKREENSPNEVEESQEIETPEIINEEKDLEEKFEIINNEKSIEKEIPALDISFSPSEISQIKPLEAPEVNSETEEAIVQVEKSNVPVFINTWQNWLKIDRSEEKIVEKIDIPKEIAKSEVINKFIDTAPKISRFKEDGTFTVAEKKDDISHLMTETLANLFFIQKLYSKAINAYKILQEKHPEKAAYFDKKILEIKESRQK